MIFHSTASEQITTSGDADAIAKHAAAKELYERALAAHERDEAEETKRLLAEASRTMFEAVRLAKPDTVVAEKKRADFTKRRESLAQLLAAYERVRREKGSTAGQASVDGPVREHLAQAQTLFQAGRLDEARAALDSAYAAVKAAINQVHGGDTLVRSLHFADKGEEYRYELDRNDTHRMLLNGVLDEKAARADLREQCRPFLDRATELRGRAESAAANGHYETAVEALEASTDQLIRAIRAAGIFIPG